MEPVKDLNSTEHYWAAINCVKKLDADIEMVELGLLRPGGGDLSKQIAEIKELQKAVKERTERGVPLTFKSEHRILEQKLQALTKRIEKAAVGMGVIMPMREGDPGARNSDWKQSRKRQLARKAKQNSRLIPILIFGWNGSRCFSARPFLRRKSPSTPFPIF